MNKLSAYGWTSSAFGWTAWGLHTLGHWVCTSSAFGWTAWDHHTLGHFVQQLYVVGFHPHSVLLCDCVWFCVLLCVQHSSRCAPNHTFSESSPGCLLLLSSSPAASRKKQKTCLQPNNVLQIVARATAQQQVCSETHVLCIETRLLLLLLSSPGAMFVACAFVCFPVLMYVFVC